MVMERGEGDSVPTLGFSFLRERGSTLAFLLYQSVIGCLVEKIRLQPAEGLLSVEICRLSERFRLPALWLMMIVYR